MVESQDGSGKGGSIKLVRGCPCFKVFGDEKLCINDDNILEVEAMEVDPQVFSYRTNRKGMLEERSEDSNVCYTSIYVNYPDNKVYCISQGWVLRIHGYDVPGNDLEDALQFLSTKDLTASAEICSECLYKFILTLADTFSDLMSRKEKTEEVKRYVDKFSLMIAVKHSQTDGMMSPIGTEDDIEEGVDHFAFLRGYLVQLLEQQACWSDLHSELKEEGSPIWLVDLAGMRELLARFEFQFYSQTLQLRDINDFHLLIKMLQFILKTSDQILDVNDRIHSEIRSERFRELLEKDSRLANLESYSEKSRTVEHNFGNILQILSRL
ncbi:MAG: hypothetical protein JSW61_11640 [Candidatus Thorarchaeota archaeon]|nr:MAG: hypothetical protein JSW61_11640 [Candidatus Thorarchaeota archaeon]